MKRLLTFLLSLILFLTLEQTATAGDSDINVLSYYAVGNSLDGQPLIDRINVLRFFPVFAMRDSVQYAKVTVYYGGNIYARYATRMENGEYWEVLLPQFRLGEAIQRIEVETHIHLQQSLLITAYKTIQQTVQQRQQELKDVINNLQKSIKEREKDIQTGIELSISQFNNTLHQKRSDMIKQATIFDQSIATATTQSQGVLFRNFNTSTFKNYVKIQFNNLLANATSSASISPIDNCDGCQEAISQSLVNRISSSVLADSLIENIHATINKQVEQAVTTTQQQINTILQLLRTMQDSIPACKDLTDNFVKWLSNVQIESVNTDVIDTTFRNLRVLQDSLYAQILHSIEANLVDTNYSGPSVRRSDILLDNDLKSATILYRNYKTALRHLPALDPAERLGVFRARYIPFAVTGNKLRRPLSEKSQAIFEVGLAFGDAIITGDDFVVEEFSPRRLGVAFAITDKLFATDAEVLALALTYDFNSYGSIAFGANFRTSEVSQRRIVERYISFGINKRAFEVLIGQLKLLFL